MNAAPFDDVLNIWLMTTDESLPVDGSHGLSRTALLAHALAGRGHVVTWWASSFDPRTHQHWPRLRRLTWTWACLGREAGEYAFFKARGTAVDLWPVCGMTA